MRAMYLVLALAAVGCGGGDDESAKRVCEPGKTDECACLGGMTTGVQTCSSSGSEWGKCSCPGEDVDAGPTGSGGGPAVGHCTPGDSESCTCSPMCEWALGKHVCDTQGNWGVCGSAACDDARASFPQCIP